MRSRRSDREALRAGLWTLVAVLGLAVTGDVMAKELRLLTDPFLQLPTRNSVQVVWFTEFRGSGHFVRWGPTFENRAEATSFRLSRMYEDDGSHPGPDHRPPKVTTKRAIWRHEAVLSGLRRGVRVPYVVTSRREAVGVSSAVFSAAALPAPGQALRILLTSDHQLKPMTPANLEKVVAIEGHVDAVFFAGDLVKVPDRASEWFDDGRGLAFFPALQGRAEHAPRRETVNETSGRLSAVTYRGAAIVQHAPLFAAIGNHDVMGRFNPDRPLHEQFRDPRPLGVARADYARRKAQFNPTGDPGIAARWLRDNSYNTTSYEEIFSLPDDGPAGERYYAVRFGDVFLISLFAARIWRSPEQDPTTRGKYQEALSQLDRPESWGYGQFPFADLSKGSRQYEWLSQVVSSDAFRSAPLRVVMLHHPIHGLGANVVPAFSPPRQIIERTDDDTIRSIRYAYPPDLDMLVNDVKPLLEAAGVDLVLNGHSHLWNRLKSPAGTHYIQTSNVGNSLGCYVEGSGRRRQTPGGDIYPEPDYPPIGDPAGLDPVMPNVFVPMRGEGGQNLPCVSSNDMTVFSILDTGTGSVRSYIFDTRDSGSPVRLFDEFPIGRSSSMPDRG